MSVTATDRTSITDRTTTGTGSDQTGHTLLEGSGAYAPGARATTDTTASSSGGAWNSTKGFINFVTGEVITSDQTNPQLQKELTNTGTVTNELNNAASDFRNGNTDLGVQDLRKAVAQMDGDPNLTRQDLNAKVDLAALDAVGWVPFFGSSMQEAIGANSTSIGKSVSAIRDTDISPALNHRST